MKPKQLHEVVSNSLYPHWSYRESTAERKRYEDRVNELRGRASILIDQIEEHGTSAEKIEVPFQLDETRTGQLDTSVVKRMVTIEVTPDPNLLELVEAHFGEGVELGQYITLGTHDIQHRVVGKETYAPERAKSLDIVTTFFAKNDHDIDESSVEELTELVILERLNEMYPVFHTGEQYNFRGYGNIIAGDSFDPPFTLTEEHARQAAQLWENGGHPLVLEGMHGALDQVEHTLRFGQ